MSGSSVNLHPAGLVVAGDLCFSEEKEIAGRGQSRTKMSFLGCVCVQLPLDAVGELDINSQSMWGRS